MKTRNLIIIGGMGLVAAYVFFIRKRLSGSAAPADVPVDTLDANEPKAGAKKAAKAGAKKTTPLTLGQIGSKTRSLGTIMSSTGRRGSGVQGEVPSSLNQYNQVFSNRVYTKVKDFYGQDANIGLYPESKRLALFQRIWMKLSQNGVSNPMMATLGQIGPAIKEIAQEGFDFRD
tara:strand:+ start:77 stop:598 length:522 start_codon:yes stop_codon:yes gene_type:complete